MRRSPARLPVIQDQSLESRTDFYLEQAIGPRIDKAGKTPSLINDMLRAKLHRKHGYNFSIQAGIDPEMAAMVAVSFDGLPHPVGIPDKIEAIKQWEAERAREERRRVELEQELERERVLKEERELIRARRQRTPGHGREPAWGGDCARPLDGDCAQLLSDATKDTHCQEGSPHGIFSPGRPDDEPLYPMRTPMSPLKRSGAFSAPQRPARMTVTSPRIMRGPRNMSLGI
jgi:hypothetical protein